MSKDYLYIWNVQLLVLMGKDYEMYSEFKVGDYGCVVWKIGTEYHNYYEIEIGNLYVFSHLSEDEMNAKVSYLTNNNRILKKFQQLMKLEEVIRKKKDQVYNNIDKVRMT